MNRITAQRVPCEKRARFLYRLSEPTTSEAMKGETFEYVVVSLGRAGDTCAFPATTDGSIRDFVGFGFGMGPGRWLADGELDDYVDRCIARHEQDGGSGLSLYVDAS